MRSLRRPLRKGSERRREPSGHRSRSTRRSALRESRLGRAFEQNVRTPLLFEALDETAVHAEPDGLAVAPAVLDEGDLRPREEGEVITSPCRDRLDARRTVAEVALEPQARGERIGVAEEDAVRRPGGEILAPPLPLRDVNELVLRPSHPLLQVARLGGGGRGWRIRARRTFSIQTSRPYSSTQLVR